MVDQVTILIEKAMQSDNDNEALAALRQARKFYRGTGTAVMPRRVVRPQTTEVAVTDTREKDERIKYLEDQQQKLMKDNQRLSAENQDLTKKVLDGNFKADDDLLADTQKKLRSALRRNIAAWTITAGVTVAFIVMVL
jgi:hypothetical protein